MKRFLSPLVAFSVMLMTPRCPADILYSGIKDIAVPYSFDGVYIDLVSASTSFVEPASWDTAPWINPIFGGSAIASGVLLRPTVSSDPLLSPGSGSDQILNLGYGTVIDGSCNFLGSYNVSETHIGSAPDQFSLGVPGYIGFVMQPVPSGSSYYGWIQITIDNAGSGTIHDWAVQSSANIPIAAGITVVPEPGSVSLILSAAVVLLVIRRKARSARS